MTVSSKHIEAYYDAHVTEKLRGFVERNDRVECAWNKLMSWLPPKTERVLEIGCGIGDITHRLSLACPKADVVGLDISPVSIEIANQLFASERVSFIESYLTPEIFSGSAPFDLIVMMDMYEHLPVSARPGFHAVLRSLLAEQGRVFLSCPTIHHQTFLRKHTPDELQPVDEDINAKVVLDIALDLGIDILHFSEVDVWHAGDYLHAVLGTRAPRRPDAQTVAPISGIRSLAHKIKLRRHLDDLSEMVRRNPSPWFSTRRERLARVRTRLGNKFDLE